MDFATACAEAASIKEFVEQYNRITGENIFSKRSAIEKSIDEATGYPGFTPEQAAKFADFFYEYIWSKLPDEAFVEEANDPR